MIISKAVDVEIFPNMFSVTFVDMRDYLQKFADCVDDKGRPIALTEKLSVKEINKRLEEVSCDIFRISDTDDSQLVQMVGYINGMQSKFITTTDEEGNVSQEPVRYDLFGFNNQGYDDLMIKALLMYFNRFDTTSHLIKKLKETSNLIIELQKDSYLFYNNKELELIRKYRLPYATVDVQQVYGLHSASVVVDAKTGERNKFGKRLKQTAVNLKWHELLDFNLPPIDEEERELYWSKHPHYKGYTVEELNRVITEPFERYILPKYVEPMLHYNRNDVFLVCEMVRQKPDEIKLRYSITAAFGVNVLCSSRANIADKLTVKFYSDMSGLKKQDFIKLRTERTIISFKKVIFPNISFQTKQLQDLLDDMMTVQIRHTNKDAFSRTVNFYGTTYTLATGGIHSVDPPRILKSVPGKYTYIHWDYTSYYPSIMISNKICPKQLNIGAFVKMLAYIKDTRVKCKHGGDINVIQGVPNKIAAEALKIVINSIYGKLGSDMFFLYDRLAQMKVTINGQLMTMNLIERLELAGIHVVSANTDGIVLKLPCDKEDVFKRITQEWNDHFNMSADGERYDIVVSRDVNNYFDIQDDGSIEYKGALDPKQYLKELKKGYDMPVVAIAVFKYFVNNTPVMETLRNHTDILDFCKTQNVGKKFGVVYVTVKNGQIVQEETQRDFRYYVSTKGGSLKKLDRETDKLSNLAGGLPVRILNSLDDKPIEERDIDYKYYYNECYKIIDPIRLGISPQQKADKQKGIVSGKLAIRKKAKQYLTLFDDDMFE